MPNDKKDREEEAKNFALDVDRMINEGLGGGTVNPKRHTGKIEQALDLEEEEPPHHVEHETE